METAHFVGGCFFFFFLVFCFVFVFILFLPKLTKNWPSGNRNIVFTLMGTNLFPSNILLILFVKWQIMRYE